VYSSRCAADEALLHRADGGVPAVPEHNGCLTLGLDLSKSSRDALSIIRQGYYDNLRIVKGKAPCPAHNEAAKRRTLARGNIWQGNCDATDYPLGSNAASFRNTKPIEFPLSNCPAKSGKASFKRLYPK
jgi:hypothetical protein